MLEKKYFEHWRITVKMRQHQRTQMAACGGTTDDMELKNMGASAIPNGTALSSAGGGGGAGAAASEATSSSEPKETRSKILAQSLTLLTAGGTAVLHDSTTI